MRQLCLAGRSAVSGSAKTVAAGFATRCPGNARASSAQGELPIVWRALARHVRRGCTPTRPISNAGLPGKARTPHLRRSPVARPAKNAPRTETPKRSITELRPPASLGHGSGATTPPRSFAAQQAGHVSVVGAASTTAVAVLPATSVWTTIHSRQEMGAAMPTPRGQHAGERRPYDLHRGRGHRPFHFARATRPLVMVRNRRVGSCCRRETCRAEADKEGHSDRQNERWVVTAEEFARSGR